MTGCSVVTNKLINLEKHNIKVFGQEFFKMNLTMYLDHKAIPIVKKAKVKRTQTKIGLKWWGKKAMIL